MKNMRHIWKEVAQRHGIPPHLIPSDSRSPRVCKARGEAAYRMQQELGMSLPEIGRRMDRHHTTVLHMIQKITRGHAFDDFDPREPDISGEWAI